MAFFTEDYLAFFEELADNNEREWFQANKKRYENSVKKPFVAFVQEIIDRAAQIDPTITIQPKEAMFRINRDIRFSKDKRPYKSHMAAVVSAGGRRNMQIPGLYFQLGLEGVMIAGGMYNPDKENLYQIRKTLVTKGKALLKIINAPDFVEMYGEMRGEKNKVLPKEFKEAAAEMPLIYHKQFFFATQQIHPQMMVQENFPEFVMDHFRVGKPFNDFMKKAVGLS